MNKSFEKLLTESNGDIDHFIEMMLELQNEFTLKEEDKGEQISKGMNPLEKSDDEKEAEQMAMDQPAAAPGEVPGANVAIGNKDKQDVDAIVQKPTKIEVSGKKDSVNKKPQTKLNDNEFTAVDAAG